MIDDEEEPIQSAFRMIVQSPNHRIFVNQNGKLVGVLSPKDLLPFLAGGATEHQKSLKDEFFEAQTKIKALVEELQLAKRNIVPYKKFFEDSPFMMHSSDFDGNILMANKILHFTLGYDYGELIGQPINKLYSHQNHKSAHEGLERIRSLGFHPPVSTLMVKKNQEVIMVDVASMLRRDENGFAVGTITVTRLSETTNMLDILRQASHMFDLESRAKSDGDL